MAQVFISFVHEDEHVASAVQNLIQQELKLGDEVFLSSDQAQMFAGDIWLDKIGKSLSDAKVVVLLLSKRSVGRPWVNFEAGAAWLTKKTIIPCCFGRMTKERLPHPYAGIHALDLPTQSMYLLESIHHHLKLESVRPTPRLLRALGDLPRGDAPGERSLSDVIEAISDPYRRLEDALKRFDDVP